MSDEYDMVPWLPQVVAARPGFVVNRISRQTLPESAIIGGDTLEVGSTAAQQNTLADVLRSEWASAPPSPTELGDLEDLSVIKELGRGGMGVVYLAVQRSLDREVAVKLLDPRQAFTPEQIERFHREVLLAASLNHPNIAHIHWVRRKDPLFYFVMEYVSGASLADLLSTQSPPAESVLRILAQVCDGLAHAHERGVVHRDLKPGNVLVELQARERSTGVAEAGFGRAVLVDFGLAGRHGEASTTSAGLLMGTPAYMSPEQARGEPTDHRGDLYSLGVVIFEAVTGRVPFAAPTPMAMAMRHISDPPPDPCSLVPNLLPELAELIRALLQKAPESRPQSATEVRQRLLSALTADQSPRSGSRSGMVEAPGLAQREVTALAVELDGFAALAQDQAFARTSFLLESWMELVERTVSQHGGTIVRQDAALLLCTFNYPEKAADHPRRALAALRDLCAAIRAFNRTHGRHYAFTAGLESGLAFAGQLGAQRLCFGKPLETAARLSQVRHIGVGLVGPQLSAALGDWIPLEPLIGVAEDLGTASRVSPGFLG